jgi:hypothetical protein
MERDVDGQLDRWEARRVWKEAREQHPELFPVK